MLRSDTSIGCAIRISRWPR